MVKLNAGRKGRKGEEIIVSLSFDYSFIGKSRKFLGSMLKRTASRAAIAVTNARIPFYLISGSISYERLGEGRKAIVNRIIISKKALVIKNILARTARTALKPAKLSRMAEKSLSAITILATFCQCSMIAAIASAPAYANAEETCAINADVILVIDLSVSMGNQSTCSWYAFENNSCQFHSPLTDINAYGLTRNECLAKTDENCFFPGYPLYVPSKVTSAKTAANSFLGLLGTNDYSGLVSFNSTPALRKTIVGNNDHAATIAAVNGLPAPDGSENIGDALAVSQTEIASHGRDKSVTNKTIILFSDGKTTESGLAAKVDAVKGEGTEIYVFGFGGDVNTALLQSIAGDAGHYFFAPDADDLNAVYSNISHSACGSISGNKYQDANNNGTIDETEEQSPLAGTAIDLLDPDGTHHQTTSGIDGSYSFTGLKAGSYVVSEVDNSHQTFPPAGGVYNYILTKGEDKTGLDFANYVPACGNGIKDAGSGEQCDGTDGVGEHQTCNVSCQLEAVPYCGDNIKNNSEECDGADGVGEHQQCTDQCALQTLPYCGDGVRNQETEDCDGADGESQHYACNDSCHLDYVPYCGDEIRNQETEQCDGSDGVGEHQTCNDSCQLEDSPYCGDGVKNGNEDCDGSDGVAEHYSCTPACTLDYLPYCGDGIRNNDEQCDGTDGTSQHYACNAFCGLQYVPYCGDAVKNGEEQCDGSDGVGEHQTCNTACVLESLPYCGDNEKNGSEQCDDGNAADGDGCSSVCQLEETGDGGDNGQPTETCGNGVKEGNEQCDGIEGVGSRQSCDASCVLVNVPYCGDAVKNGSEECDGSDGVDANHACTASCLLRAVDGSAGDGSGQEENGDSDNAKPNPPVFHPSEWSPGFGPSALGGSGQVAGASIEQPSLDEIQELINKLRAQIGLLADQVGDLEPAGGTATTTPAIETAGNSNPATQPELEDGSSAGNQPDGGQENGNVPEPGGPEITFEEIKQEQNKKGFLESISESVGNFLRNLLNY